MSKIGKEGYCGSCFGGLEPPNGCCQSCEDVRKSYVDRGWAFTNPEAIEQCQREGWTEKIQAQSMDGCEISGRVRLKKTASSLIFSFGQSFQLNSYHTHELVPYLKDDSMIHDFGHYIHHLRFESDDEYDPKRSAVVDKIKNRLGVEKNPMDNTYMHHRNYMRMVRKNTPNTQQFMIQYFVKVVNSEFGTLDGQHVGFCFQIPAEQILSIPFNLLVLLTTLTDKLLSIHLQFPPSKRWRRCPRQKRGRHRNHSWLRRSSRRIFQHRRLTYANHSYRETKTIRPFLDHLLRYHWGRAYRCILD
jgi:hypothetical protein